LLLENSSAVSAQWRPGVIAGISKLSSRTDDFTVITTTNSIYWECTGLVTENVYLYYVKFSTCLVDAYEGYSCFGEVSFSS
jgi:hypothetical protein